MKTKNFLMNGLLIVVVSAITSSCSGDFLDVNDNPNDPSISNPGLTLPVAQNSFASLTGTTMNYLGNYIVYNYAVPSDWQANDDFLRYNVTNDFYSSIFEDSYASIFKNLTYIENYEDPSGTVDYSAYDVIAETIKGFQYQYLVDLYGDVPYTEANQRGGNTTPKYDDAETIYKSVIDSLTSAANSTLNLPENVKNPGSNDIIFGGDMTKWAQFANTIKLRMLIRLSNAGQDSYINDQIALIDANGAGYITSNVIANPGYTQNANQESPYYGYAGYDEGGIETGRHNYTVATDYTIDYLKQTNDTLRLKRIYAEAVNGGYKGVKQAVALPDEGFTSDDLSGIGPGILKSADQDQPIMLLSEALFLQSEATVRGYLPGGDAAAKDLYEQAIAASFEYLGVDNADASAEAYYSQNKKNISWDASSDKIEAIITQKWVALNSISGLESWIEFIRTGFPANLTIPEDSPQGVRPVSLLYPTSEYSRNSKNVPARSTAEAFTHTPFWK